MHFKKVLLLALSLAFSANTAPLHGGSISSSIADDSLRAREISIDANERAQSVQTKRGIIVGNFLRDGTTDDIVENETDAAEDEK
ncbi:MAG: hypothetical protein M1821_005561 [Bathelium mastoideum]|nr:MAG: hypothetical protein M1821_005561 [Bathelium mastoideum]